MARQETVLNVFISSPGDLVEDRDTAEEALDEVNRTLSASLGIRLLALRWETNVTPGIGTDAQSVINSAIGSEYDVFVGIMGARFGEPTPRYGSGTEEEFALAYERNLRSPNSLRVLFYFKDSPLHPSKINPTQLAAVHNFKMNLSKMGVLYSCYTAREEFQKLLRIHLSEIVQTWHAKNDKRISPSPESVNVSIDEEDKPSILDLLADSQDGYESLNATIHRIGDALNELAIKTNERTAELETLNRQQQNPDFRAIKRTCSGAARDMDEFRTRLEPELTLFSKTHIHVMDCTAKIVSLIRNTPAWNLEGANLNHSMKTYIEIMERAIESIIGFRESVGGLPRLTIELNKSKNRTVKLIDRLIESLTSARNLTAETHRVIIEVTAHLS